MGRVRQPHRRRCARHLLDDHEVLEEAEPRAAVGAGHRRTEHAEVAEHRPELPGERVRGVDVGRQRGDLALGEQADSRPQLVERDPIRGSLRRIHPQVVPTLRRSEPCRSRRGKVAERRSSDGRRGGAMPRLSTHVDTGAQTFRDNAASMQALVEDLQVRLDRVRRGGGEDAVAKHEARGKLTARARIERLVDPGATFLELSPLGRGGSLRRRRPRRRHRHRDRSGARRAVRRDRERRHREGRHVLPDDGEEAPARAGDRRGQPPAVHLPRRFGRRVPAVAGRRVPRPGPFRADLLQPGADVGRRHPADRRGHGLVHGGRRVRAGDVGRNGDRARHGHDLPRRTAAREGGDRRGRDRRGARRRGRARTGERRGRPRGARRRARPAARS